MVRYTFILISTACIAQLLLSLKSFAQSPVKSTIIYGEVVDTFSGTPVGSATVRGQAANDSEVHFAKTQSDGRFRLKAPSAAGYTLIITAIGFGPDSLELTAKRAQDSVDAGIIRLHPQALQLHSVVVKGRKPLIRQASGRIEYDMQADPDSKGRSLMEMLSKVPYVSADINGQVLVKGSGDFKIYINGKPSALADQSPTDLLKTIAASTVQKIEVITGAMSKYDAEGAAGIINIVTIRKRTNGYHANVNGSENFPAGGPEGGGSVTIKNGRFGVAVYGGGTLNKSPFTDLKHDRKTSGDAGSWLREEGISQTSGRNGYLGSELSLEVDSLNLLTAQASVNGNKVTSNGSQEIIMQQLYEPADAYQLDQSRRNKSWGGEAGINYQKGFKGHTERLLTLSYRFFGYNNKVASGSAILARAGLPESEYGQLNKGTINEQAFQLDLVDNHKKFGTEAGVKGILRNNTSEFQYQPVGEDTTARSTVNRFTDRQYIIAAYNSWHYSAGKWNFVAGARFEHTEISASFSLGALATDQAYSNLVPSILISRQAGKEGSMELGFSQRIKRPGINRLNPFEDRSNPNYVRSGNPDLRSSVINSLSFSYNNSRKLALNVGLNYSFMKNLALEVSRFDATAQITRITYENLGRGAGLTTNLNARYPITDALHLSVKGDLTFIWLEGTSGGALIRTNGLSQNYRADLALRTKDALRLNLGMQYGGRNLVSMQAFTNPVLSSSLSLSRDIVKGKLTFTALISNPFSKYRNNVITTSGANFDEVNLQQQYFRSARLSLNYNFGRLKEQIKKSKRGIRIDDLSN